MCPTPTTSLATSTWPTCMASWSRLSCEFGIQINACLSGLCPVQDSPTLVCLPSRLAFVNQFIAKRLPTTPGRRSTRGETLNIVLRPCLTIVTPPHISVILWMMRDIVRLQRPLMCCPPCSLRIMAVRLSFQPWSSFNKHQLDLPPCHTPNTGVSM